MPTKKIMVKKISLWHALNKVKNVITFPSAATGGFVVTTRRYQAYAYGLPVCERVYLEEGKGNLNDHLI